MNARTIFIVVSLLILSAIGGLTYFWTTNALWSLVLFGPVILMGVSDMSQKEPIVSTQEPSVALLS